MNAKHKSFGDRSMKEIVIFEQSNCLIGENISSTKEDCL